MAVINGTAAGDFIHRNGDGFGNPGLNEINTVTTGADTIGGAAGNDLIFGDAGNDTINGDDGNDVIHGGQGIDILNGGVGNDAFRIIQVSDVSGLAETINGGNDTDTIDFFIFNAFGAVNLSTLTITDVEQLQLSVNDATLTSAQLGAFTGVFGTFGQERVFLSNAGTVDLTGAVVSSIEEIRGNSAANTVRLTGVAAGQTVNTLGGNDVVDGSDGGDTVDGGTGTDTLTGSLGNDALAGGNDADSLSGGDGNDTLTGGAGLDAQTGGAGNDIFRIALVGDISGLAETLDGGIDIDTLDFQSAGAQAQGPVNLSPATLTSVETLLVNGNDFTLTAAQLGAFTTIGGSFATDRLILSAGGTADLTGAAIVSIEEIRGSAGNDAITLTNVANGQTVDGKAGNDSIRGSLSGDTILGDLGNDTIAANDGNDTVRGGQGTDNLQGGIGNDTFQVIGVSDIGGLAEKVNGGNDVDALDFQSFNAFGIVSLSLVTFTSIETLLLSGNIATLTAAQTGAFATINGSFATERIFLGAAGTADLTGASVNSIEEFRGTASNDTFVFAGVAAGQTINSLAGVDSITGSDGNDAIDGGDGNDTISSGAGNDVVTGGLGKETMTGGLGADTFDFNDVPETGVGALRDIVTDFVHGQDIINLQDMDADNTVAGNQSFTYIAGAAFGSVAGQLRYTGGVLHGDIDGNSVTDLQIQLTGSPAVTSADLVL